MLGLGCGIVVAAGANAVMSSAPEDRTGDAGAIQESAFAFGCLPPVSTSSAPAGVNAT
jgi:DHA2 family multidrug resistance protein-like MFS transporter